MLRRLVGLFLAVGLAAGISGCEASLDTTVRSYKQRQMAAAAAREGVHPKDHLPRSTFIVQLSFCIHLICQIGRAHV